MHAYDLNPQILVHGPPMPELHPPKNCFILTPPMTLSPWVHCKFTCIVYTVQQGCRQGERPLPQTRKIWKRWETVHASASNENWYYKKIQIILTRYERCRIISLLMSSLGLIGGVAFWDCDHTPEFVRQHQCAYIRHSDAPSLTIRVAIRARLKPRHFR